MRALASSLLVNAETRIVYRQQSNSAPPPPPSGPPVPNSPSSLRLAPARGLWRIKHRSFVVQHHMHPAELEPSTRPDG
jgi:hypothetical protein